MTREVGWISPLLWSCAKRISEVVDKHWRRPLVSYTVNEKTRKKKVDPGNFPVKTDKDFINARFEHC